MPTPLPPFPSELEHPMTSRVLLPFNLFNQAISLTSRLFPTPSPLPICTIPPYSPPPLPQPSWLASLFTNLLPPAHGRANPKPSSSITSLFKDIGPLLNFSEAQKTPPERYPPADRIVAIGDVHGDVDALRAALQSAQIIDSDGKWSAGKTVLVQVGDQLDRGHRERDIYRLLFHLQDTAPLHGGQVHILLGNHELMNSRLDFRYVTKGGFADFERPPQDGPNNIHPNIMREIRTLPREMRARAKIITRGGSLAIELARRAKVSVIVGDNIFVHGGLNPQHLTFGGRHPKEAVKMLAELNRDTSRFLCGVSKLPVVMQGGASPVWLRDYSRVSVAAGSSACRTLQETLKMVNAKRMIVGHTPQLQGINSACGGRVWRIDTGMSKAYGGVPEAIEIRRRGGIRIFTPMGVVQGSARFK